MYERIEGTIISQEPISHIGETLSTIAQFKREKTLFRGKIVEIPVISGNALRGIMRRRGSYRLLEMLGIRKEDLGEDVQHALFSGGMLKKGAGGGTIDMNFIKDLRTMLPIMSVWGTTIGQQMIGGKLDVGQMIPISCQTAVRTGVESNISIHSLLDEVAHTRRDDMEDKTKGNDKEAQKQQMRYQTEVTWRTRRKAMTRRHRSSRCGTRQKSLQPVRSSLIISRSRTAMSSSEAHS